MNAWGNDDSVGIHLNALVLMGVTGSGKSTIGRVLANRLAYDFLDADDHHSDINIKKMSRGEALSDRDRSPWLKSLSKLLHDPLRERSVILACSALKAQYRSILSKGPARVQVIYLQVPRNELEHRLSLRRNHFAGASLLDSQFQALEVPDRNFTVNASGELDEICQRIERLLRHL